MSHTQNSFTYGSYNQSQMILSDKSEQAARGRLNDLTHEPTYLDASYKLHVGRRLYEIHERLQRLEERKESENLRQHLQQWIKNFEPQVIDRLEERLLGFFKPRLPELLASQSLRLLEEPFEQFNRRLKQFEPRILLLEQLKSPLLEHIQQLNQDVKTVQDRLRTTEDLAHLSCRLIDSLENSCLQQKSQLELLSSRQGELVECHDELGNLIDHLQKNQEMVQRVIKQHQNTQMGCDTEVSENNGMGGTQGDGN